jgi:quercetin dioxygenase-like cupin family protein
MRVTADTSRIDWREIGAVSATPDIEARSGRGEKMSYARFNLQSGAEVPQHGHDNEEFGFVISGSLDLWVADRHDHIAAGESFLIARGASHRAVAGPDGCDLLECYTPPREPISHSPADSVSTTP